jgi:hypothetical protein
MSMDTVVPLRAGSENDRERSTLAGFPRWAASWVGYAVWLLVIALGYLVYSLAGHLWVLTVLLILGSLGGIALGTLLVFRQARLHALLAEVAAAGAAVSQQRATVLLLTAGACILASLFRAGLRLTPGSMPPGGQPLNIFVEILGGTVVALVASLAFYLGPWAFWRAWDLLARKLA